MWIIKIIKIQCFYPPRILNEHWCIYSCLQIPPRENLFQYVRRVYATAINFPCITSLSVAIKQALNWSTPYTKVWSQPVCFNENSITLHCNQSGVLILTNSYLRFMCYKLKLIDIITISTSLFTSHD